MPRLVITTAATERELHTLQDEAFGRQIPFAFLDRVSEDFMTGFANKGKSAAPHSLDRSFGAKLKQHMVRRAPREGAYRCLTCRLALLPTAVDSSRDGSAATSKSCFCCTSPCHTWQFTGLRLHCSYAPVSMPILHCSLAACKLCQSLAGHRC